MPEPTPAAVRATRQEAKSEYNKVLILGSSVGGGLDSREAQAVLAARPGALITVVTPAQWTAMSANQFSQYHAIIIGDAACQGGTAAFDAAIANRDTWGPVIDSDVVILSTDPTSNNTPQLVENAIRQVLVNGIQYRTSMYIALGCAYQGATAPARVTLLEPFGIFEVQRVPGCADSGHMFQMYPPLLSNDLWDGLLPGDGCAARSVFTRYPNRNFAIAAIASDSTGTNPIPGRQAYEDFTEGLVYEGSPYVLVRGAANQGGGCGGDSNNVPSGEECDLGDGTNGAPNPGGQDPAATCSFSCRREWCGDGHVDTIWGEVCDNGQLNGRTTAGDIINGNCSASCQIINVPRRSSPPTALCMNRTVMATNTCGMTADINNGSTDPDGDLVGCTQSPAGPYAIGNTTVTLTCTDAEYQVSTCTGVVTVTDKVLPTVTLVGGNQSLECNRNMTYSDPGATGYDPCPGIAIPAPRTAGGVSMGIPNTYTLTYTATDSAGNKGTRTRTVTVSDTQKPTITVSGLNPYQQECAGPFTDPGATASDTCASSVLVVPSGTVNTSVLGAYTIRYNAADPTGNAALEKTRAVNVVDRLKPTVTITGALTMAVECNDPAFVDPGATASDTCAGSLTAVATPPIAPGTVGTQSVRYQATDPSGNVGQSTNSRTVTVSDNLPPTLSLNGAATMGLECAAAYNELGASASDQCTGPRPVVITGTVNNRELGPQTLTYSTGDGNGHNVSATRTVTVRDTQAPGIQITGPLNLPVECGDRNYADPGATANDACAGALPTVAEPPANPNVPDTYNVRYRATDPSGNTTLSESSRTVTVSDTLPPTVTLNGAATQGLECATAYNEQGATASDQCAGPLAVTTTGTVDNRRLGVPQTLTYSANDGRGHTDSKSRTVTVSDTLNPNVTINGALTLAVECNDPTFQDPGASASDTCAGPLTAVAVPAINVGAPGPQNIRYQATDPSGNVGQSADTRAVTVRDTLPPLLSLRGANPQAVECGSTWADPGSMASDQCAGPLTPTVSGGVNPAVPAPYTLTYTVNDNQGHIVSLNRTVNVSDTLPPTIVVQGSANDSFACGTTYVDPGAMATDACDGTLSVTATQTGNADRPGTFTIAYSATDAAGHAVTSPVQRTVTVSDDAPPTLVMLGAATQVTECAMPWNDPGATANDACFGDVTSLIVRSGNVTVGTPGSYPLTYNVSDPAGQSAPPATRTVRVQDTQRPVVTVNGPLNIPVECGDGTYADPGASASDACAGALPVVPSQVANPGAPGTYTISYSATDPSNNTGTSSSSRTVTVSDTLPPTLTLNAGSSSLECATPWNDPGATANDQCAGTLAVTRSGTVDNRLLNVAQTITYSATDGFRTVTQPRSVTVSDTLPPAITVNGPLSDSFACGFTYVDPGATATDACAQTGVVVTATQTGDASAPGTFTIRYTATDPSNNSVTSPVSRTVTVNDNAPPTLVLLGSNAPSLECGTAFNDPGATADDACFGDVTNRIVVTGSVNSNSPGSYPLTYNVTDPSGQSAPPATRTVSVNDTLAPSITVLGALSQQLQCDHAPYADPGATATDACAGNLAVQTIGGVNTGAAGSYTLSYRATDPSGNTTTSSDSRTVTVVDNLPPSIQLVGGSPAAHECGSPYNDPGATANDACAGDMTANIARSGAVNGGTPGQYQLNYTVTDPSNLTASTQRTVNVNDTLAPSLTLVGQASQIVECAPGYVDPGATATDACAGNLDAQIQVTGSANSTVVGNYNVSYTVADLAGNTAGPLNRAVTVRDTQAPSITVNGALNQQFDCGSTYVDPGATASDVCAGNVPVTAVQTGNPSQPGTFTIRYTATDPSNNTVTAPVERTVTVNDDLPPTLVLLGAERPRLECGSPFTDPGATANDACFGNVTASITASGTVNTAVPNDYPIIYNVTDAAGNSASSVSRTVEVRDTQLPSITVVGPLNNTYECGTTYSDPGATATDSCAGNLTSAIVATQTPDPNAPANFIVTYSVTDPSGNTAVSPVSRTVTMNDNAAPTIALNGPATQNLECWPGPYNDMGATANDLCVGTVPVTVTGAVNTRVRGTYTLEYSARDTVGNTSPTVTRTVSISDTMPPAITLNGPNAITLECKVDTYTDLGATADDICSGPATVTVDASAVNRDATGAYLVRYVATDASGNRNETVRNVIVDDTLPPTLALNAPNPMVMECATPYVDPGATASDVCQGNVSDTVFVEFNGVNNMLPNMTRTNEPIGNPYIVRYQANDRRGHTVTLERDVRVRDTTAPVLTVTGAPVSEIECGSQPDLGVVATDTCYGNIPVVATPALLPRVPGEYDVTYSATDPAGNTTTNGASRHFTVVDTGMPELVVNGPTELFYECTGHAIGNVWNNPGASATDVCEGELQVHQYNSGDDDGDGIPGDIDPDDFGPGPTTEVEGLYYVQYLAWDESYNIQGAILSVYVQDTLKPVLFLNGEETVQTQCFLATDDPDPSTDPDTEVDVDDAPYIDDGATGDDQCYGDVTPSVLTFSTVDKSSPGNYQVEYQVRDGAFNWANPITRTVQVVDNLAPKLVMNAPIKAWPADNTMRRIQLSECGVAWDRCDGYMDIMDAHNVNVTSNDAGNDAGDIVFDPEDGTFFVRAERNADGSPRVYTASFRVYDGAGNYQTGQCRVFVPVNQNDPAPTALPSGSDVTASR